jgi:hypothetical protein
MDNTNNEVDLLQIKIEKAKSQLTDETLNAINAVDWKDAILKMRISKGYSFEQLGTLETETELVLCGLLNPRDYPKEIQNRMGISPTQTNELVNEMNEQVFSKIKEELIKSSEKKDEQKHDTKILDNAGIEIIPARPHDEGAGGKKVNDLPVPEKLEIPPSPLQGEGLGVRSILAQKMSAPTQTPIAKTDHSLPNITPPSSPNKPVIDPYREIPE